MLLKATNNFSQVCKIETDSFGSVYRATLDDHRVVSVLDPNVPSPTPFERKAVAHVGSLAMASVSLKGRDCPSMIDIVNSLQRALDECMDPVLDECLF
ncbi:serine/threonine-protein kinase-like protein ccr4 [Quercus suber]|uniref:Serine/threonine-protein kinase-like protein ccr4 n=1 Tax=Quercus suber TaxID=58331 RepID=A0AAW0L9B6_QUESU